MQMHNDLKHWERDEKDQLVVENTKDCDVWDSDDVCDNSADSDSDGNTGRIKDQIGLIIDRIKDKGGVQDISQAPSPVIKSSISSTSMEEWCLRNKGIYSAVQYRDGEDNLTEEVKQAEPQIHDESSSDSEKELEHFYQNHCKGESK